MKGPIDISTAVQAAALALDSALTPGPDGFLDSGTIQGAATAARAILNALGEGMVAEYDRILEATGAWPVAPSRPPDVTKPLRDLRKGDSVILNDGAWTVTEDAYFMEGGGGWRVHLTFPDLGDVLVFIRKDCDYPFTLTR